MEDAFTLFNHYQKDFSGMDMSGYACLFKELYINKIIDAEAALKQLAFDPNSVENFTDLIGKIEQLRAYLKTLYPSNSSFLAAKTLSNKELITILNDLQLFEKRIKQEGNTLPAGRITYIITQAEKLGSDADSVPSSEKAVDSMAPTKEAPKDKTDNKLKLPQTGEEKAKLAVTVLGGVIVIFGAILFVMKRRKANK